jgi:hypothetical protein
MLNRYDRLQFRTGLTTVDCGVGPEYVQAVVDAGRREYLMGL